MNIVFDLGGVVLTWNPRAIIARAFADEASHLLRLAGSARDCSQNKRQLLRKSPSRGRLPERPSSPVPHSSPFNISRGITPEIPAESVSDIFVQLDAETSTGWIAGRLNNRMLSIPATLPLDFSEEPS